VGVALVGRLTVEDERRDADLGSLGLDHRQLDVSQPHAAPLDGHVRQPQTGLLGLLSHLEQESDVFAAFQLFVLDAVGARAHDGVDEVAHAQADRLELWGQGEVDRHPVRLSMQLHC
jgi:hypothetical protein